MLHHLRTSLLLYRISHSLSLRCISTKITVNVPSNSRSESFVVSYLIQEFGLSPKSALIASKYAKFKNSERPEKVVAFFKSHGFSATHIAKMVKRLPRLLAANPDAFLSKLEFFSSEGFSSSEIVAIFFGSPELLLRRVEFVASAYMYIKDLVQSDKECIVRAFKRMVFGHMGSFEKWVKPNIKYLRDSGCPEDSIKWLLINQPSTLFLQPNRFIEVVEEVKGMGIVPLRSTFGLALSTLKGLSKLTWDMKIDVYERWGWSKEQTLSAFVKYPSTIRISEKKIMETMDFWVNKVGSDPSVIARHPALLGYSLRKRLVPRHFVLNDLFSKGLIKSRPIVFPFSVSEEKFLQNYVLCYENEAQHLLRLYHEKLDVAE